MTRSTPSARTTMSLSGEWRFALDPDNAGIRERWFAGALPDTIALPGTTDEAEKGDFTREACDNRLSRVWRWIGPAWYQKTIDVPTEWADKRILLFLERTKDSQVWVDDHWIGSDDSLSTPHEFDLSSWLTPGEHVITILVDNAKLPPIGPAHQVDERTQTNWNGIVGRIELVVTELIWIDAVQAYPNVEDQSARVAVTIQNNTRWTGHVDLRVTPTIVGDPSVRFDTHLSVVRPEAGMTVAECVLPLSDAPLWDEFDRSLIRLNVSIEAQPRAAVIRDTASAMFGMRDFATERGQFAINGRRIFLRGKNDGALFPLTGYAPMDREEWLRLLGIAASYGINHYRFHSWCPPEAAFEAADELGIYFQVELPNKRGIFDADAGEWTPPTGAYETLDELAGSGADEGALASFLIREGERMLRAFGNHPSFVMMTLGNELDGDERVMRGICDHFRAIDARHLYAMGTNHFHWDVRLREGDDFWVIKETGPDLPVRGASFQTDGHVEHSSPSTMTDYSRAMRGVPMPVIGHEMAQYEVYPDYSEIPKYTGVTRAHNLEIFRERLEAAGMLDQANAFLRASGLFSAILHREDVEAALRTPGFGGFQMLDLQDFSGQGTALVGMLNVFMESKGLIDPEEWREFCSPIVPLLRMDKYTWESNETFRASIDLAHYGPTDLAGAGVEWSLSEDRRVISSGVTRRVDVSTGDLTHIDYLSAPLESASAPSRLSLTLELRGTGIRNEYPLWVYPSSADQDSEAVPTPEGIRVVRSFDADARSALEAGERVVLFPNLESIRQSVGGAFQTSYWCWPMFRQTSLKLGLPVAPGTLGFLCDPEHPVFADFPTEFHSNWQWWHLVKNGRPMILDETPQDYRPTLQVIDNFARNHKLALLFEATVGRGRLLVCSIDLPGLQEHPEARQLLRSIYRYVAGEEFAPASALDAEAIAGIV